MSSTAGDKKRESSGAVDAQQAKRKRDGNHGKWQTTHQKAKTMRLAGAGVEPGDVGVWVTCVRGMEAKAAREIQDLFDEYGDMVYGIRAPGDEATSEGEEGDGDIEAAIGKELGALKSSGPGPEDGRPFTTIRVNLDCVLFVKTRAPIEPVDFVKRICSSIKGAAPTQAGRRSRYLNRLTPITLTGKVAGRGIEETARVVLAKWFDLREQSPAKDAPSTEGDEAVPAAPAAPAAPTTSERPAYSYAIRESIRNNKNVKRDEVIKLIASLIGERHKVNLKSPDKVILVDIYQALCGMSVVDGDWDDLKRYNIHELASHRQDASPTRPPKD